MRGGKSGLITVAPREQVAHLHAKAATSTTSAAAVAICLCRAIETALTSQRDSLHEAKSMRQVLVTLADRRAVEWLRKCTA